MPDVFKKQYTKPVPAGAERCDIKGVPSARWTHRGKKRSAPLTADGQRIVLETDTYYGTVGGRTVCLEVDDKDVARTLLSKMASDAALSARGLSDPFADHKAKPLAAHLSDYQAHLEGKGDTARHVRLTTDRIRIVFAGCSFTLPADIDATAVSKWLTAKRTPTRGPLALPPGNEFKPADVATLLRVTPQSVRAMLARHNLSATGHGKARRYPRATVETLLSLQVRAMAPETCNHHIRAVRGFCRWMVRAKRLPFNPLDTIELLPTSKDTRRNRRELTTAELSTLLQVATASRRTYRGLDGEARSMLYRCAAVTGFRASALAGLIASDFHLTGSSPTIVLPAKLAKNGKEKRQPVPTDHARTLGRWLEQLDPAGPVWPGTWASDNRGADMLRGDLRDAGIPYATPGPGGTKLYADFHALRHTYITSLGRSGVDLRTLQLLAGHSKPELTARYSHRSDADLAAAANLFPRLAG